MQHGQGRALRLIRADGKPAAFYPYYSTVSTTAGCNFGMATGSRCPDAPGTPNCKGYQIDAETHFASTSPEYSWLRETPPQH